LGSFALDSLMKWNQSMDISTLQLDSN
jgi:hypothetical protein